MAEVLDVAKFFIHLAQQQEEANRGDLVTNMRLQKLLYFAQGWHLARYGKPLFSAPLEAWTWGPVVPAVYHAYKSNGKQGLTCDPPRPDAFTPEEYDLLLDVAREYDNYSTAALVNMSHEANAPWANTEKAHRIDNGEIEKYFSSLSALPSFDDILDGYPMA